MHWIGRFEDRVSCVLSVAMTLCFPSVSVYGESLSWPGVCPGSQAVQKPEGILLPPVRSGWASWAGGGPCRGACTGPQALREARRGPQPTPRAPACRSVSGEGRQCLACAGHPVNHSFLPGGSVAVLGRSFRRYPWWF